MPDVKVEMGNPKKPAPPPKSVIVKEPKTIADQRADAVDGIFQLVGLGCIMVGQYADAGAINMHGHDISVEIADLAEKNAPIANVIDNLLQIGPYAGLVMAVMPLAMQLLANHKVMSAEKMTGMNVVKPEILESQVKTQMARQAIEALQAQKEAEEELARMQEEWQKHCEDVAQND
jgi:hypothetical protein